jgi:CheY-like chemotaxis protein
MGTPLAIARFNDTHRDIMAVTPLLPAADRLPRSADAPAEHTVLYVEDHPVNVLLMQALFTKRPQARLIVATTGEEGLRAARQDAPDLLLLDLRLPDCHGTELLKRLRELPALADVTAVAVTAEDTRGVLEAGFAEIWRKPMDMHTTLSRLDCLLHARMLARAKPPAVIPSIRVDRPRQLPAPIPFPGVSRHAATQGALDTVR